MNRCNMKKQIKVVAVNISPYVISLNLLIQFNVFTLRVVLNKRDVHVIECVIV